jgi:hypothetical protein
MRLKSKRLHPLYAPKAKDFDAETPRHRGFYFFSVALRLCVQASPFLFEIGHA